ncbi:MULTISPECIES: hypothetical protein [Chryseobacterium]|uniref:Uncharacterized protein n=1 Tax=Chryseobacterium camelliae TaxID=1265445 RepID=A0ABU0TMT8_9FLAO|nr:MULTISPECIES: hypothetical protein [Chryseobacterium]MDT3407786.1 hypothetical protein [Pseudacidovorax intermedius]MDQ1098359.1 hypothetical protein [Chryseobacterium camelliae]MDQ1102285.1 hypothetical protein [Chryseobacterium sp. SORGH_AS_1048]MDR6085723.1 hypothetical protein [Chryseobacterium sp. SORGH_AS_0909]MDR6130088.1 hypothetical protein [Chryseobacterium sp. SORGH_AS_1175]
MTKKIFLFLVIAIYSFINAQSITFVSEKTGKPLPKVSVFGKDGSILAFSDIDGKIDKQLLKPDQEKFQLVYDNVSVATLSYSEFDKDIIKINDRIKDIEAVVIKNDKPAKYILIKGNFNAYVTVNDRLNAYADGIVTYVFDNKTRKLKSTNVEQYRIFRLQTATNDTKNTSSYDYVSSLELPKLKHVGNPEEYKNASNTIKELKGDVKDQIEVAHTMAKGEEIGFLGFRFYDFRKVFSMSFEKGSGKTLRDFLEYNELIFMKLKHKSEPEYNQLALYNNFYTTEFSFSNDNDVKKVRFSKSSSNYQSKYWQDASFPNMQPVFSSFFKGDLKEEPNEH